MFKKQTYKPQFLPLSLTKQSVFLAIFTNMKTLFRLYVQVLIGLSILSCCRSDLLSSLQEIEGTIQDKPDEALEFLRQIDLVCLKAPKEKGLYYLLLSMALDKNYIDVTTDSLIRPAVDYYSRTHDRYHKFLSYYYLGRIYENMEDYQQALSAFILAESNADPTVSSEYHSRLYARKGRVYFHQFALDKAYEEADKYSRIAIDLPDKRYYIRSMLDKVGYKLADRKHIEAGACHDSLETWMDENKCNKDASFYESRLPIFVELHPKQTDSIVSLRSYYIDACASEGRALDYLILADSYIKTKEPEMAYKSLLQYSPDIQLDSFAYYGTLAEIMKAKGDYKEALDAVNNMDRALANINLSVFNNDVRFLEERSQFQLQQVKLSIIRLWLIIGIIMLSIATIILVSYTIRKRLVLKEDLNKAKEEYEILKSFAEESGTMPESFSATLNERLAALRPFTISQKRSFSPDHFKKLDKVSKERHNFLLSTGLLYAMTYPRFVASLINLGLIPEEIGLCALYISGYSSKELNKSLYFGNVYRINAEIRNKLGIPANGEKILSRLKDIFNNAETVTNSRPMRPCMPEHP